MTAMAISLLVPPLSVLLAMTLKHDAGAAAASFVPAAHRSPNRPRSGADSAPPSRPRGVNGAVGPAASEGSAPPNGRRGGGRGGGKGKRVVLIRHGRTYMNEYLAKPGSRWGDPGFTDVFDDDTDYRDSPLSPRGARQARDLSEGLGRILGGGGEEADGVISEWDALGEIDLIAVSPLTRALQTLELGLLPHVDPAPVPGMKILDGGVDGGDEEVARIGGDSGGGGSRPRRREVPIVALPLASERVYLVSDIGLPTSRLAGRFPYVDFESEFDCPVGEWWYVPRGGEYIEWRPHGQGQTYAHPGEPDAQFRRRMAALYDWLDSRDESTVALICHWGVIEWLIGADFDNCEVGVVPFESLRRTGFAPMDVEEEDEILAHEERSAMKDVER